MTEQSTLSTPVIRQIVPRDLLSKLYREIGISAVAAALECSAAKPQRPAQSRKADIPAVLRDDEAA